MKKITHFLNKCTKRTKKIIVSVVAVILSVVIGTGAGAASSYMYTPTKVSNTLTAGKINCLLTEISMATDASHVNYEYLEELAKEKDPFKAYIDIENENAYCWYIGRYPQLIPGTDIPSDLSAVVREDSEECWVFVSVFESDILYNYIDFSINPQWTKIISKDDKLCESVYAQGYGDVYCTKVTKSEMEKPIYLFENNTIHIKDTVTRTMETSEDIPGSEFVFLINAIQAEFLSTATEAWNAIHNSDYYV